MEIVDKVKLFYTQHRPLKVGDPVVSTRPHERMWFDGLRRIQEISDASHTYHTETVYRISPNGFIAFESEIKLACETVCDGCRYRFTCFTTR